MAIKAKSLFFAFLLMVNCKPSPHHEVTVDYDVALKELKMLQLNANRLDLEGVKAHITRYDGEMSREKEAEKMVNQVKRDGPREILSCRFQVMKKYGGDGRGVHAWCNVTVGGYIRTDYYALSALYNTLIGPEGYRFGIIYVTYDIPGD